MENVNTENLELNAWLVLYNEAVKRANAVDSFSDKEYWILMAVGNIPRKSEKSNEQHDPRNHRTRPT